MNELSKFLVESILLEADGVENKVVVYAGRFQPFHKGHYATYSHLVKKFGKNNVYIGTSNKTDNDKSPFNFKEKVMIMTTMFGIPKNQIVEVKNPYVPTEVLKKFDKDTTAFITVVGKKDASRLGGKFFTPYKDGIDFEGYEDRGYVYIAPEGGGGVSGTEVRKGLSSGSEEEKKKFFSTRAYPKFNQKIFNFITNTLNEEFTIPKEVVEQWLVNNVDLIKEASQIVGKTEVDDGPNFLFPSYATFDKISQRRAEKIGYTVLSQIMSDELTDIDPHPIYPTGPVKAVTPFPAGVAGKTTATNQKDYYGSIAYDKWWKHVTRVAGLVGYSLIDYIDLDIDREESTKDLSQEKKPVGNTLKEDIKLPVNVGDTILTGRFKNKKVVVKTIGKDEHGMPTINGKKVVTFRILKEGTNIIFENTKEDEKYVHIGYGRFKLKGKEDDENSPTFQKDDDGGYSELERDDKSKTQKPQGTSVKGKKMFSHAPDVKKHTKSEPKKQQSKEEPKSKVTTLQGKKSGRKIQTLDLDGGGKVYGTEHGKTAMVDDIIDDVKKNIPKERWKDIVFVGEGGATGNNGELEFNDEMDYAVPKFKELGAGIDTWDGDEMDVHNDQSKLYKRQMEKTGLNQSQVNAGNWASMIGQGEGTDTMSPDDFLDDEGKEYIQSAAKEAGFPPIKNWNDPTDEDIDTLYRLSFPEDYNDKQTKIGDIQDAFNETRDEHLIKKSKELSSQGKIPIVIAGESHVGLVDKMMTNESVINEIPMADLVKIDTYADKQLNPVDVVLTDKHFFDRLTDPRNKKEITPAELIGFFKRLAKKKKEFINFLNLYGQIVAKDNRSKINIPFMKQANKVIAKTIMRKDDFKTSSPEYSFEDKIPGGLAGGMGLTDIAKHHNVSVDVLVDEFKKGISVEMEHTSDREIAKEIALDHLYEDPKYYTKLKDIEEYVMYRTHKMYPKDKGGLGDELEEVAPHGYSDQKWIDDHNKELKRLRKKFDKEKLQYNEPYALGGGITESLILEGGAYGHMNHPFDTEINLTFGQLKDIVNRALEGNLELTREKTDGQALAVSWRDGRLVAARNKGHLKNKGAGALDINGVAMKFAGRGELEKAYNFAMKDLTQAISKLSEKQRDKIFKGGACFMNLEVIYPTSVNVIPYGQALLVFHGTMEYNEDGIAIGENQDAARILAGMIKQINADVQSAYTIQGPPVVQLPKSKNLSSLKGKYNGEISKLQSKFKLKDTDGVAEYHQAWWMDFVNKKSPSKLDNKTLMGLVKRWAFYDKGFRLDNKNITDEKTLEWAKGIDKNDHAKMAKDNIRPFEDIFLGVGAEVLSFMSSALTANPDSAVRDMKKRLDQTIKDVQKGGDPKKVSKLKLELERLNAIGGKSKIVPNEGIVFVYGGKTFKLTGTFAPLNQILGLFYE